MTSNELRQKYLKFFEGKGHKIIPSASLVPKNDPTTLFTGSGMQPMIPYLLGESHPDGKKITDSQLCFRAQDIKEVGNNRHTTFFEMLGNWSLGDYFKKEQLSWIFEFLTEIVGLDPQKIYVSVFLGDEKYNLPKDNESADIWKKLFADKGIQAKDVELDTEEKAGELGMQDGRIFYYGVKKNLWSRFNGFEEIAEGEPFGPDSEMFYEFTEIEHDPKYGKYCHPNCDCGRFLEIGNSVFMEYKKLADNRFEPLPNKNVDFGGGLERILAASQNEADIFKTDLFRPIRNAIVKEYFQGISDNDNLEDNQYYPLRQTIYEQSHEKILRKGTIASVRIIADHMRAAVFLIKNGVIPTNKLQGYILRKLIRRSAVKMYQLMSGVYDSARLINAFSGIVDSIFKIYDGMQDMDLENQCPNIKKIIKEEISKFSAGLPIGLKEIEKYQENLNGKVAFDIYQTYGLPWEITLEIINNRGWLKNRDKFAEDFFEASEKHKELSRTASVGMFKGGLTEQSEITTKYHTATHLLHAALRKILGEGVAQKGSNITSEMLRFDFSYPEKISPENLHKIEDLVQEKIKEGLSVTSETMGKEEALKSGALGFFTEKYGDKVTVYTIGDPSTRSAHSGLPFSKEVCGGPHVKNTIDLGNFKIQKEESVSSGIRRIYATLSL